MIQYTVFIFEEEVTGDAEYIVNKMMLNGYFTEYESIDDFLIKASQSIWRLFNIGVDYGNGSISQKCEEFLNVVIDHGLVKIPKKTH